MQVVVFPYRRTGNGVEFAVFRRADNAAWQGVAGGAHEGESPLDAAIRESFEEAAIPPTADFLQLRSADSIPIECIGASCREHWPEDTLVIPNHAFAVDCSDLALCLSEEHTDVRWVAFAEAMAMLAYEGNRTALRELGQRLRPWGPDEGDDRLSC